MRSPTTHLDYFAAHAPDVPDWFACSLPMPPEKPDVEKTPAEWRSVLRMWVMDPTQHGKPHLSLEEDNAVRKATEDFIAEFEEWRDALMPAWAAACGEERFFAWRWFYAQKMVDGRISAGRTRRKERRNARP